MRVIILSALFFLIAAAQGFGRGNSPEEEKHILRTSTETFRMDVNGESGEDTFVLHYDRPDSMILRLPGTGFRFAIFSDLDSVRINVDEIRRYSISIEMEGRQPLVFILDNTIRYEKLVYDNNGFHEYRIVYETSGVNPYLQELIARYPIEEIAANDRDQITKVRAISTWVNGLWEHHGYNEPEKNDALSILEEVGKGNRFRCVEYGIVTAACLKAVGMPARTLWLKMKDADKILSGAGHVVLEVYLEDLGKWIMVDPQFNVIIADREHPLNALELQHAITERKELEALGSLEGETLDDYLVWIYPYLYYLETAFDNREGITDDDKLMYDGKTKLVLRPAGAAEINIFQREITYDYIKYTCSPELFYAAPMPVIGD